MASGSQEADAFADHDGLDATDAAGCNQECLAVGVEALISKVTLLHGPRCLRWSFPAGGRGPSLTVPELSLVPQSAWPSGAIALVIAVSRVDMFLRKQSAAAIARSTSFHP